MQRKEFRDGCDPMSIPGTSDAYTAYEGASAPPYELMDNCFTHENMRMTDAGSKSGRAEQLPHKEQEEFDPYQRHLNILYVSEQDVKEALLHYVSSKHFYRSTPAKHMKVQNIVPLNTYRYRLETFTELRQTYRASELYDGGFIDSCDVAPPPAPWDVEVDPPPLFTDCEMHIPIPHTYSVEKCPDCKGRGKTECPACRGRGKKTCSACNGSGMTLQEGFQICVFCGGSGSIGKNNISEHVVDKNSGFPITRLQDVTGKGLFTDEHSLIYPIINFPEPSINESSRACIEQHRMQFASESRILMQKQTVEVVPVSKVEYEWKGKLHSFFVYGNEKKVYAKAYPGKYCSIM
ncbi:protein SSUH2 homolog isoform X2 [Paroedura picta]|uniref:protein SSUH2 homolog isoform X2 n=1 Tax=Paroedura picta TaxID=143630 RepID=UPI0040572267